MAEELEIKQPEAIAPRWTGILWGPAKAGKTTLLCSLPGKKLIINVDPDGYESIAFRTDYSVIDLSGYDHKDIIGAGEKVVPKKIEQLDDFGPGDTVIFDSMSSYGWAALNTAILNNVGAGEKGGNFKPTIEAPGLAAYGARTNYQVAAMRQILKVTTRKRMHCWFTAHMDTPTTNKQGDFLYQSMTLSENGTTQVSLSISDIWFIDRDNKKTTIAIQPVRGRKPMGSRIFDQKASPEFESKYDIDIPDDEQPYSMSTMWNMYLAGGKKKLPTPDTAEFLKLYKEYSK